MQVIGRTRITPLSGMTANVELGSLRLRGRPGRAPRGAAAHRSRYPRRRAPVPHPWDWRQAQRVTCQRGA